MDESRRAEFIAGFKTGAKESMVAFIVLGGVFAEGIDLPEEQLSGAVIVSTGIHLSRLPARAAGCRTRDPHRKRQRRRAAAGCALRFGKIPGTVPEPLAHAQNHQHEQPAGKAFGILAARQG